MAVPGGVWMLCTGTPDVASTCLGRAVIRESLPMPCATHACPGTCLDCCEPCLLAVRASHYPCMPRDMPWLLRALSASVEFQRKDDGSAPPLPLPKLAVLFLVACTARLLNRLAGHKHEGVRRRHLEHSSPPSLYK